MTKEMMVITFIVISVMYLIGSGMKKQADEQTFVKTECMETQLYVIGDKGHVNMIYDCTKE